MDLSTWLIFTAVAIISILTPGPAILLAISNSMRIGLRKVAFSSAGNITGLFIVSSTAMIGLGTLLKTSSLVFTLVKAIGAGYLIYLGLKQWRSKTNIFSQNTIAHSDLPLSNRKIFTQGVLIATTNPKAILFFTALFPQFIKTNAPLFPQFLILTGTFMALSFLTLMGYASMARFAKRWFSNDRRASLFNRLTGSIFMFLGVCLLKLKR